MALLGAVPVTVALPVPEAVTARADALCQRVSVKVGFRVPEIFSEMSGRQIEVTKLLREGFGVESRPSFAQRSRSQRARRVRSARDVSGLEVRV